MINVAYASTRRSKILDTRFTGRTHSRPRGVIGFNTLVPEFTNGVSSVSVAAPLCFPRSKMTVMDFSR